MAKPRLSLAVLAALYAGLLAACDTDPGDTAQGDAGEVLFTGFVDRTFTGEAMPDITLINPDGETRELADMDRPFLINLWAQWHAPSRAELPLLNDLARELEGEVEVLTVSVDLRGAAPVEQFLDENDLANLPRWMDPENDTAFAYGSETLPLSMLYDENGNEVWRMIGAYDWSTHAAREAMQEALAPVKPAPRLDISGDIELIIAEYIPA